MQLNVLPDPKHSSDKRLSTALSAACGPRLYLKQSAMDKTIRKYTSFDEIKADEYRYWQSRPAHERLNAAAELSLMQYQWKDPTRDVHSRLQRTLIRVQRTPR